MKVLIWNVRKIGKVEKQREAKDYIRAQEADLIGLVETKVRNGKAELPDAWERIVVKPLLWRMRSRERHNLADLEENYGH